MDSHNSFSQRLISLWLTWFVEDYEMMSSPLVWIGAIAIIIGLLYWFVIKPWMDESSSANLDDIARGNLIRATNDALRSYRPIVGEDNLQGGNDEVRVELRANGEIYIRTVPGLNVRLLRRYTIAATQGHESWDSSPIIYVGENLAKTELAPKAQAKKGAQIGFSNLLKPAQQAA